eukprot:m51a1_g6768 putative troponin skeletal muscle-like (73) ;mRNA; r:107501-107827
MSDNAKAFSAWDKNGDGFIDRSEIMEVLKTAGVPANMIDQMAADVFAKADTNKDGRISFEEFQILMKTFPLK